MSADKTKIFVPPLKIQGIKTKLVPLIKANVILYPDTVWIEPFMGSGVVGFNIAPEKAIFADTNPYIIDFYNQIKTGQITSCKVRTFLEEEGRKLAKQNDDYYYIVRDRFNKQHDPLDFLFLNRCCFNGMIRFNKNHDFNVPYGHKPQRFSKAYITKIVNQVKYIEDMLKIRDWTFVCQPFTKTIEAATATSFIYCDPPYIGRHVDYYDSWDEECELSLCKALKKSNAKFMLSTWDHNDFRYNKYIDIIWNFCTKITKEHFYHIGGKESNRNPMVEALLINYQPPERKALLSYEFEQMQLQLPI